MELETNSAQAEPRSMEPLNADLLGTVSHELRGPLAAIKGYATTLLRHERRLSREDRHQFLVAINDASDRLEVIVERLLEVSQLETGQIVLQRAPVDAAHLAGEAIAAAEERVEGLLPGHFTFHLRLEDAGGKAVQSVPLILADPRRLREVLDNLLENAIQYSLEGGPISVVIRPVGHMQPVANNMPDMVTLKAENLAASYAPRPMLEICVSDNSQGIPVDHLERIFNRFYRVDTRMTREVNGLGLGLTICKGIAELHDGIIWAENRIDGKGSVFHLRLPLSEEPLT